MASDRITVDPAVMGDAVKPGLRVPVATVVSMFADGLPVEQILADLLYLEHGDITESLRLPAEAVPLPLPGVRFLVGLNLSPRLADRPTALGPRNAAPASPR